MSTPVEALSISSLTSLFANPPQYPRNPTHETNEPLVLYIVRVPGSKDVFLTPLKPPTKASISLEAIQTSLYYLHVETPEDDTIRQSFESERQAELQKHSAPSVLRKPLPSTPFANYPASQRPPTPPKSYPHYQPTASIHDSQADRYASRGSYLRLNLARTNSVPRKPVGARPLRLQQPIAGNSADALHGLSNVVDGSKDTRRWSVPENKPVPCLPRLQVAENTTLAQISEDGTAESNEPASSPARSGNVEAFTMITIIRRDPTSGTQWNVGSIKAAGRRSSLALLQPVDVMLTSPGYMKFARTPDSPRKPETFDDLVHGRSPNSASPSSGSDHVFRRRLGFRLLPNDRKPTLQHVRTSSSDVLSDMTNGSNKKPQQVYAFTSPWQGVCAFSNGVDGRSLKCKHSLPTTSTHQDEVAAPVAELRFNLPWTALRQKISSKHGATEADKLPVSQLVGKSTKEQWRRSFQTFKNHTRHGQNTIVTDESTANRQGKDEIMQDDESRISLKLGREKAGGGFKGSSAKLGKLIIEDEGLKMCDLVVASCMGVWWQHYMEGSL